MLDFEFVSYRISISYWNVAVFVYVDLAQSVLKLVFGYEFYLVPFNMVLEWGIIADD